MLLCVAVVALGAVVTGCDLCLGFGSAPEVTPRQDLQTGDVRVLPDGAHLAIGRTPTLKADLPNHVEYEMTDTLRRRDVHVSPDGAQALVGRTLYRPSSALRPQDAGSALPDSLTDCTFAHQTPDLVCAVVTPDTLVHPQTDRRLPVQAARARVVALSDVETVRESIWEAPAVFTGRLTYTVQTVAAPALSLDDRRLAWVQRTERRRLVADTSGAIVDDVLQAVDRTLVVVNRARPDSPLRSIPLPSNVEIVPWVALAPDGQHVAVAEQQTVRYAAVEGGSVREATGRFPTFTGSAAVMAVTTGEQTAALHDLRSGAVRTVTDSTGVQALVAHPSTDRVYYLSGDGLVALDATDATRQILGPIADALVERLDPVSAEDYEVDRSMTVHHLAPLPDPRRLLAVGLVRKHFNAKDDGC